MTRAFRLARVVRRAGLAAAAAALVLPAVGLLGRPAGAGAPPVSLERQWHPFAGTTNTLYGSRVVLDVAGRTAFVLTHDFDHGQPLVVQPWNLDTLRPKGKPFSQPGVGRLDSSTPVAVDQQRHLLFVAGHPAGTTTTPPVVDVYAFRKGAVSRVGALATRYPAGYAVLGLQVDAARGRLFSIGAPSAGHAVQDAGAGVGGIEADAWRLDDVARGTVASPFAQPIAVPQTCGQVITKTFAAGLLVSRDGTSVFFGCVSNRGSATLLGPNPGDVAAVAELDLAGGADALRLRFMPGNFADGDSFVVAGQHRMFFTAPSTTTTNLKVFDAEHLRFVGNVGIDDISLHGVGVNPVNGRGYYVIGDGLGAFDLAATPVTQGVVHEDLATELGNLDRPFEVDPKTSRLFVTTSLDVTAGTQPYVAVIRDRTPTFPPDDFSVERDALDAPESPGKVESNRSTDVQAVGAEYRMVGGPTALLFNVTHVNSQGVVARPGTRDARFAVTRDRLTGGEASAEVVTQVTDDATNSDLSGATAAAPVSCNDFGDGAKQDGVDTVAVTCDLAAPHVTTAAEFSPPRAVLARAGQPGTVPAGVVVRSAKVATDLTRTADGTATATVTAEANAIDILGVVRIGRVTATLDAAVHGRLGTAKLDYTRTITAVTVNGTDVCGSTCSADQVATAVNRALGGRAVVEFPSGDMYASGKGVVARLTDDRFRHVERVLLDDQPDDDVLLPAMQITVYTDGTMASREIVSLASISTQAIYRNYRVGSPQDPHFPKPSVPVETPGVTVPGTPGQPGGTVVTGGSIPATRPQTAGPLAQGGGGLFGAIGRGVRVAFRSPGTVAGIALMWSLLAVPVYLAARRRLLLELPRLRRDLEEA